MAFRQPPRLYVAVFYSDAEHDLMLMPRGPTKRVFRLLFNEGVALEDLVTKNEEDELEEEDAPDIEDLPDPGGGWSTLRVDDYLAWYRPLTDAESRDLGASVDILVSRIRKIDE